MRMLAVKRRWTAEDLDELPDDGNRYEVIDGELYVTPAPVYKHQDAIAELFVALHAYLEREPIGRAIFAPADVRYSALRAVQPDLFVIPFVDGRRPERFEDAGRLLLAIEVLSPSSARADRVAKRTLYREEGVPEYWLVDLDARTIERSTPADPRIDVLDERIDWRPEGAATSLEINLSDYFARVLDS